MSSNRIVQMANIQKEGLELFKKKNADYGDAFSTYGTVGVMLRISDKLQRFVNINKTNVSLVNDESLRDTLIDLHNYAAMAIMLLDEDKKNNNNNKKYKEAEEEFLIPPNMPIY